MAGEWIPLLISAMPFAGAAIGFALWSRPQALKIWTLIVPLTGLAVLCAGIGREAGADATGLFLHMLPVAAFLSLLGQPVHPDNRPAWLLTLVLLGAGMGALAGGGIGLMAQALFLGLVGLLLYRYWNVSGAVPWWGIGTCGAGAAGLLASLLAEPSASTAVRLVACAMFLPLVPFHGGYVAAFRGLPGNLPAFLAVALPVLGIHGLLDLLPHLSSESCHLLTLVAMASALYGALKALVQTRVRLLAAYAGLSLFAVLWWYVAATRSAPPQSTVYLLAVSLVTSGFLLAWHAVQARYGEVDLRAVRGLAYLMPRFSTLVFLLTLAAIGLPPFGVYAGFMGMLLTPTLPLSGALAVIISAVLVACWYVLGLAQQLLFGRHRTDLRYRDLSPTETAALVLIVVLLTALGLVPPRLLDSKAPALRAPVAASFAESQ
jgi:NADH-quinone oxidoreductase subunit M